MYARYRFRIKLIDGKWDLHPSVLQYKDVPSLVPTKDDILRLQSEGRLGFFIQQMFEKTRRRGCKTLFVLETFQADGPVEAGTLQGHAYQRGSIVIKNSGQPRRLPCIRITTPGRPIVVVDGRYFQLRAKRGYAVYPLFLSMRGDQAHAHFVKNKDWYKTRINRDRMVQWRRSIKRSKQS